MKIAVYTLTRERLDYTKIAFESLREKAGCEFSHFVVDNGSQDGTVEWLNEYKPAAMSRFPENIGISAASNFALGMIFGMMPDVDVIVKMDNDCRCVSHGLLATMAELVTKTGDVLSPRVVGINRQPSRGRTEHHHGFTFGYTAIVGGLFHCVPAAIYRDYRYPLNLPKAWGQDDQFCKHVKRKLNKNVAYVEELTVEHYEGTDAQAVRYPEYFKRKHEEEQGMAIPK